MTNKFLYLSTLIFLCFFKTFAQENQTKKIQIAPYGGVSLPQREYKDLSQLGNVVGISIDKYFSKRFALGLDINSQTNQFLNPLENSTIVDQDVTTNPNGYWTATSILLGPTYRTGGEKLSVDFYAKGGVSFVKSPQQTAVISTASMNDVKLLDLKNDKNPVFGLTSGIRINYAFSKRISVFLNPQYLMTDSEIEYFHSPITEEAISNPDILSVDGGELCYLKPSYINVNLGISLSLGGGKTNATKNDELKLNKKDICDDTKLKNPYNGETYFADSAIVPEFNWINHSKPIAKSYVFELFYGEKRLFEKTVKQSKFKFTKKMASDFYGLEGTRDYSWRVTTNYNNCESTTTGFNYFTVNPRNTSSRSTCSLEIVVGDIYCSDPAYSETGTVRYSGTFTVKNNTPTLPGVLIPHPSALGAVQLFGTNILNASLTYSQGGFSSPCIPTAMMNTPNGPALPPLSSSTYCFDLEVPFSTSSIKLYANMNTYDGGDLPAECPDNVTIELPVCACCDNWDFTDQRHSYTYEAANNNPYISHSILQSFKLPGTDPIKQMKAEIVYVKHEVDDPKCYSCTTQVKDMGLFSAVNAKPKDILADPLDWVNNNEGTLSSDANNDGYSNRLNWQARNPITGVDFASRYHNFQLWLNLPGDNSFECCSHNYEVWIRYTYEDINCITCSTLIEYDLSATSGTSTGSIGIGSGGVSTGLSNPSSSTLSPSQLLPKN